MKFIVNKELFNNYPNLRIGVVISNDINNTINININSEMDEIKKNIISKFDGVELVSYPVIRVWRDIYKSFGEKKCRSSVEALIRRTINGNDIPSINPLVDIYNMISVKYELPCGGEDIDNINDDVYLDYAKGTEKFLSLGESAQEIVNEGEIVYKFNDTVICRNFNYRESDITKLTDSTKNAILVVESILPEDDLDNALKELSELLEKELTASTKIAILTKENNEIIIK